jgi:hypothetical protein
MINDMGGVYSSGMMDECTMECIARTRDMEGYVLACAIVHFLILSRKRSRSTKNRFLLECVVSACHLLFCPLVLNIVSVSFFDFALLRVSSSGPMVLCMMENSSLVSDMGRAYSRLMMDKSTIVRVVFTPSRQSTFHVGALLNTPENKIRCQLAL